MLAIGYQKVKRYFDCHPLSHNERIDPVTEKDWCINLRVKVITKCL